MVEVGGRPILWHIMRSYAARGFKEFVVALGYRGDVIKRYFLDYFYLRNSLTIDLRTNQIAVQGSDCEDWTVHLRDTGLETQTGGRLRRLADELRGETFMMTYGDGVCSVDPRALLDFHRRHGKLATITAVRPPARFGGLVFDGIEPMRIGSRLLEQAIARAQRTLQRIDAARMRAVDGEHEAVEEAAALRCGAAEQGVHCGRHPDDAHMIGECRRRRSRLAIDAAFARCGISIGELRLDPGSKRREAERALEFGCRRP